MGSQHSGLTRQSSQLLHQFLRWTVRRVARVLFKGHHDIAHERLYFRGYFGCGVDGWLVLMRIHRFAPLSSLICAHANFASGSTFSAIDRACEEAAVPRAIRPLMPCRIAANRNMLNAM